MTEPTATREKAFVLLHADRDELELAAASKAEREVLQERLGSAGEARLILRLADDPLRGLFPGERPEFGAIIEITTTGADAPALDELLDGVAARTVGTVDPARSTVVVGTEHVLRDGSAPYQLFFFMRPKEGMSVGDFHQYWRHVHAVHHARLDAMAGYRQLHGDAARSASATRAAGLSGSSYAGVAETFMPSIAGLGGGSDGHGRGDRVNFVDEHTEGAVVAQVAADAP